MHYYNFLSSAKKELATFFTRSIVFKVKNTIIKTFDLVIKVTSTDFGTRLKFLKPKIPLLQLSI
jgi:hypothetical protein